MRPPLVLRETFYVQPQAIIERSSQQDSADVAALRDQINQADKSKKKLEDKYLTLSDNFEHLKARFFKEINQIFIILLKHFVQ